MEDWSGEWTHYSNIQIVSMNPKQFHQDPLGIYFFPKEYKTQGGWKEKTYKYTAKFKGGKVLDFADIDIKKAKDITSKVVTDSKKRDVFLEEIDKSKNPIHRFYELVRQNFMGSPAKFNKVLRELGYDAVFDDTKTIHPSEVQLIVLNPSKIKVTDLEIQKSGSGYKDVLSVSKKLKDFLKDYGEVVDEKPKKTKDNNVSARITVKKGDDKAVWSVTTWFFRKVLQGVSIHLNFDSEMMFTKRSYGGHVDETQDISPPLKDVKHVMDTVFKK